MSDFCDTCGTKCDDLDCHICLQPREGTLAHEIVALRRQLAEARAKGYREGLEAAAKAVADEGPYGDCATGCYDMTLDMLRELAARGEPKP